MQFTVSRVEPGADASRVVVCGELSHGVRVIVDLDTNAASVAPDVHGIREARVIDAIAAAVVEGVTAAAGERGAQFFAGQPRPDNSRLGKVMRMRGELSVIPPAYVEPAGALPAQAVLAAPETDADDDGPTLTPDVTGDVQIKAGAVGVKSASTASQPSVPPSRAGAPVVAPLPLAARVAVLAARGPRRWTTSPSPRGSGSAR